MNRFYRIIFPVDLWVTISRITQLNHITETSLFHVTEASVESGLYHHGIDILVVIVCGIRSNIIMNRNRWFRRNKFWWWWLFRSRFNELQELSLAFVYIFNGLIQKRSLRVNFLEHLVGLLQGGRSLHIFKLRLRCRLLFIINISLLRRFLIDLEDLLLQLLNPINLFLLLLK